MSAFVFFWVCFLTTAGVTALLGGPAWACYGFALIVATLARDVWDREHSPSDKWWWDS